MHITSNKLLAIHFTVDANTAVENLWLGIAELLQLAKYVMQWEKSGSDLRSEFRWQITTDMGDCGKVG